MAYRVLPFAVSIPAGTTQAAPFTKALALDGWDVVQFDLEVPPGPGGLMGFQLYNNGVAWIPYGAGNWIVWDDHSEQYPVEGQPNAGGWACVGYNGGVYPHLVIVRAHVNSAVTQPEPTAPPQITFITTPTPAESVAVL